MEHYQFPASMSIEYQSLSPFGEYGSDFNVFEVYSNFSVPLRTRPTIQPFFQVGTGQYDSRDYEGDGDKWDHIHLFSGIGVAYSNRFARDFELGLDLAAGYSNAFFNTISESTTYSLPFYYSEFGGRIALNPSYNLSVQVRPKLKYQKSFLNENVDLTDFDGLSLGIGVSIQYRFGEDPDSAAALIRSLKYVDVDMPRVFAAMQSYYLKHPAGYVVIENKENRSLQNLDISFYQSGLMDAPTVCVQIDELKPGESRNIELLASYNNEIFSIEGVTPFTGEIIARYEYRNRPVEQRQSVSYDLFDKSSLTWDDDRKVATFITPADSALRNYTSFIRQAVKKETISSFNQPLQVAIQVYRALDELGCLYQSDPVSPFTMVQDDPLIVDSISLSRETLERMTGDCDDLTVLYCSLLETVGIETAFITVPGHIFPAFNTGVPIAEYRKVFPNRSMFIVVEGQLWVPVEITMVGSASFSESWRKGLAEWSVLVDQPDRRRFTLTREAQQVFRPVGLRETDLGLQYGNSQALARAFSADFSEIQEVFLASYEEDVREKGRKQDFNRLGIGYSLFARYDEARQAFQRAVSLDRMYLPALANSANLELISGSIQKAIPLYEKVLHTMGTSGAENSPTYGKLLLNLSRAYFESGEMEKAGNSFAQAENIVPEQSKLYSYLDPGNDALRASMPSLDSGLIFVEDEVDE